MLTRTSSTADATFEIFGQVRKVVQEATGELSHERADRIKALLTRIQELERRGFLKRQQYTAPTTGEFERRFAAMNKG